MDNECPEELKNYFRSNKVQFQLISPNLHRNNLAEKAIGTFKDHLIAGLSSADSEFPIYLWYRIIGQAQITLNLLRPSRINPRLSDETQLNGAFNYNKTPLALPGTKVVVHEPPNKCRTWAAHGIKGWYVGPAPDHYRCHCVYIPQTRAEHITQSVEFFPHLYNLPFSSPKEAVIESAKNFSEDLQNPHPQ